MWVSMTISEFDRSSFEILKPFFIENSSFEQFYNGASTFKKATLWTEYQDVLIKASGLQIEGIQNKLRDARSEEKLLSTLSELRTAVALAEEGHSIRLIPDKNTKRWNSPPDLELIARGFDALIEVTRWAPDDSSAYLDEFLTPIVEDYNLVLKYYLPSELSKLVVTWEDRNHRTLRLIEVANCIKGYIESVNLATLPLETIIHGVRITLETSERGQGYVVNPFTAFNIVPEEKYGLQLFHRLQEKASKPIKWPPTMQRKPYFMSLEVEQAIGQHSIISRILYGSTNFISYMKSEDRRDSSVKYPEIVEQRLNSTYWRELLLTLGFDSTRRSYINDVGFFLKDPNASRVCGVITLHRGDLEFYPNPFADPQFLRPDFHHLLSMPIASAIANNDHRI